jgi:hypothetical protein
MASPYQTIVAFVKATLYLPQHPLQVVSSAGLVLPDPTTGFASVPVVVHILLQCAPELVDVLACGNNYVVYTIFDSEDEANVVATRAVNELTGIEFDVTNEDELLRGPVLIVSQ